MRGVFKSATAYAASASCRPSALRLIVSLSSERSLCVLARQTHTCACVRCCVRSACSDYGWDGDVPGVYARARSCARSVGVQAGPSAYRTYVCGIGSASFLW